MKRIIACILLMALSACAPRAPYPEIEPREWDYQKVYCNKPGWELETVLSDGTRADCLSPTHAVELDRVYKWRECLDQAEHYAALTGRAPMCVLILDREVTPDLKDRIGAAARDRGIALEWIR